jgi:hypothetical protein
MVFLRLSQESFLNAIPDLSAISVGKWVAVNDSSANLLSSHLQKLKEGFELV